MPDHCDPGHGKTGCLGMRHPQGQENSHQKQCQDEGSHLPSPILQAFHRGLWLQLPPGGQLLAGLHEGLHPPFFVNDQGFLCPSHDAINFNH